METGAPKWEVREVQTERGEEEIARGTRFFSQFERTAMFLGKFSPSLASLNFEYWLGIEVLEREVRKG